MDELTGHFPAEILLQSPDPTERGLTALAIAIVIAALIRGLFSGKE